MYVYDDADQTLVEQRVVQFADQTRRFLAGQLSEDEFRTLRLQNGLYIQRHAPMLRVAIPYGMLSAKQMRMLAHVARRWDRGYAHFGTRQNIQFNWPRLEDVPQILAELVTVRMYAIQTGGNCVRNTTTDHFAGIAPDELVNPLVWCELIRHWSMLQPELAFLPRKFKIAVSGAPTDRAAIGVHDIGLQAVEQDGKVGFRVWVGGRVGRTPIVGKSISPFVAWPHLLTYLQAMLRVYSLHGRRDNKYRARIKIPARDLASEVFAEQVEKEWSRVKDGPDTLRPDDVERVAARFSWPAYDVRALEADDQWQSQVASQGAFVRWMSKNVHSHRVAGYAAVTLSLKQTGVPPGDITADQMDAAADIADRYGFGELRVSHEQNLVLADVRRDRLHELWRELDVLGLAPPNVEAAGTMS